MNIAKLEFNRNRLKTESKGQTQKGVPKRKTGSSNEFHTMTVF